jgi:hypothetical protein
MKKVITPAVREEAEFLCDGREKFMVWGAHAPSHASDRAPQSEHRAPTRVATSAVARRAVDAASTDAPEAGALPKTAAQPKRTRRTSNPAVQ